MSQVNYCLCYIQCRKGFTNYCIFYVQVGSPVTNAFLYIFRDITSMKGVTNIQTYNRSFEAILFMSVRLWTSNENGCFTGDTNNTEEVDLEQHGRYNDNCCSSSNWHRILFSPSVTLPLHYSQRNTYILRSQWWMPSINYSPFLLITFNSKGFIRDIYRNFYTL